MCSSGWYREGGVAGSRWQKEPRAHEKAVDVSTWFHIVMELLRDCTKWETCRDPTAILLQHVGLLSPPSLPIEPYG
jgi:hypothetical protein